MADAPGSSSDDQPDPQETERQINAFIDQAEQLVGPPVPEVAAQVMALMDAAWQTVQVQVRDVPRDKLIAVMLFIGREARTTRPDEARHWQLHAASTILSGLIGAG